MKADALDRAGIEAANRGDWAAALNQSIAALQFAPDNPQIRAHIAQAKTGLLNATATSEIRALREKTEDALATADIRARREDLENRIAAQRLADMAADFRTWKKSLAPTRPPDAAIVPLQVAGIQNALRQLNKSMSLDASQRQEWEKASERASHEARWMAVSAVLDLVGARVDERISDTEGALAKAIRQHRARLPLRAQLADLKRLRTNVDRVHGAYDVIKATHTIDDVTSPREALLGDIWTFGERVGVITVPATAAKSLLDATYLVWVQADSVLRIKQINSNQDRYLAALRVLKVRMEAAVAASKKHPGTPAS